MNLSDDSDKRMTKSELARMFGISIRTVHRTMKVAQIRTSRTSHDIRDIGLFTVARRKLAEGETYRQVADYFATRQNLKEIYQL